MKQAGRCIAIIYLVFMASELFGQKLQIGIGVDVANTFFHRSNSDFDNSLFRGGMGRSVGVYSIGHYRLSDNLNFSLGIGVQPKKYSFRHYDFNFPDVEGYIQFKPTIVAVEIPLLISYEVLLNENLFLNYQLGAVLGWNSNTVITISYNGPNPTVDFPVNDTISNNYSFSENLSTIFSPDVYAGISLIKRKEGLRKFEIGISYQYGFVNTQKFVYTATIETSQQKKIYNAVIEPKLSYLAFRFVFYPKWLAFPLSVKKEIPEE